MLAFPKTPADIARAMTGRVANGRAVLVSPRVQNHAAFLARSPQGQLNCVWFGGSLEGKADICIFRSHLTDDTWSSPEQLTDDPDRSEQNPVLFYAPDGRSLLFHTAQPGGDQDRCVVRMREIGEPPQDMPLPGGSFVRARPVVREDGAWLLPLFHCTPKDGARWTGRHDTASVAISEDAGGSWRRVEVPGSTGCVHMTIVPGDGKLRAFFRRRQSDFVHRCLSLDGGATWSEPSATTVPNNNSSIAAIRMTDGRVALCCNPVNAEMSSDRRASLYDELGDDARPDASGGCTPIWGVPRAPLVVAFSDDDGQTFPRSITVAESTGTCLSNNSEDGRNQELSYPALSDSPDGGLDVAFTLHRRAIAYRHLTSDDIAHMPDETHGQKA